MRLTTYALFASAALAIGAGIPASYDAFVAPAQAQAVELAPHRIVQLAFAPFEVDVNRARKRSRRGVSVAIEHAVNAGEPIEEAIEHQQILAELDQKKSDFPPVQALDDAFPPPYK